MMATDSKNKKTFPRLTIQRHTMPGIPYAVRSKKQEEKEPGNKTKAALDRQSILLLTVQGLHGAATALSILFVNVFIFKQSRDFGLIGWFALFQHLGGTLTFYFAGKWVKEHNKMITLRIGISLSAVMYLVILFLDGQAARFALLLGTLQGISSGLFWLAFNVVYFEITGPHNRDRFNGIAGLLGSLSGMLAPWLSGFIIGQLGDGKGYPVIFSTSLAVFIVAVVFSFFLKKRKVDGKYEWFYAFKHLADHKNPWRKAFTGLVFQGIREGIFFFLVGLLVYEVTQNEFRLGTYSFITSAVGLLSFWLIGRWMKPKRRLKFMLVGTIALLVFILPFFVQLSYPTLLIFGIGTSLFFPMFAIPMTSSVFDLIGKDQKAVEHRVEYVVLRETGLNVGRILGNLLFIAFVTWIGIEQRIPFIIFLVVIGSSPIISWIFMRKMVGEQRDVMTNK
ncbi:MFS transporter [Marinicrinis lubricantis]|uniref:MFS transporter n=1 Tax=Marinicrinis lubricantis TaxID=2086470 RepID=A0ABW1ILJ7_9BACL